MRTVFLLMDSLNRHCLPMYGGWARTPNLQRLADRGVLFTNHWCGSLPCMPARREMMTGRLNFLEARLAARMRELLVQYEAPACQFPRLGL